MCLLPHFLPRARTGSSAPLEPELTVLFVPHPAKRPGARGCPLGLWGGGRFVLTFVWAWFGYDYVRLRANERELVRLRIENCQQAEQIESLAQEAAAVQEWLVEVDQLMLKYEHCWGCPLAAKNRTDPSRGRLRQPQGGPGRRVTTDDIQATLQGCR